MLISLSKTRSMKEVGGSSRSSSAAASVSSASEGMGGRGRVGRGWWVCRGRWVCRERLAEWVAQRAWGWVEEAPGRVRESRRAQRSVRTEPGHLLGEAQHGAVGGAVLEVGVVHGVACRVGGGVLGLGLGCDVSNSELGRHLAVAMPCQGFHAAARHGTARGGSGAGGAKRAQAGAGRAARFGAPASASARRIASAEYSSIACLSVLKLPVRSQGVSA